MKVVFLDKFSKDLDKIKDNKARQSIKNAILKVEKAPSLENINGLKRLKGEKGAYRLRVGKTKVSGNQPNGMHYLNLEHTTRATASCQTD